jgi:vacuolar-type H+-ATPase subunit H
MTSSTAQPGGPPSGGSGQQPSQTPRAQAAVSSLDDILDEIAGLVQSAKSMPMSSSAIVNRSEILGLVERARRALPGEVRAAEGVLSGADEVIAKARSQAAALIESARGRADELVTKEQVHAEAESRAATIVASAEARAATIVRDADEYIDRKLAQFEVDLFQILSQVKAGRSRLADRVRQHSDPDGEG